METEIEEMMNGFDIIVALACANSPSGCFDSVRQQIRQHKDDVSNTMRRFVRNAHVAIRALFNYVRGMACMSCVRDQSAYVAGTEAEPQLVLAQDTCTVAGRVCAPYLRDIITLNVNMVDLVMTIGRAVAQHDGRPVPDAEFQQARSQLLSRASPCGGTLASPGDCLSIVCNQMLSGLSVRFVDVRARSVPLPSRGSTRWRVAHRRCPLSHRSRASRRTMTIIMISTPWPWGTLRRRSTRPRRPYGRRRRAP